MPHLLQRGCGRALGLPTRTWREQVLRFLEALLARWQTAGARECPMALALQQRRPIRGMEAVAERPDGTRVPFIPYPTPLFDESGQLTGAVNMLVDISERKRAEADIAERQAQLAVF